MFIIWRIAHKLKALLFALWVNALLRDAGQTPITWHGILLAITLYFYAVWKYPPRAKHPVRYNLWRGLNQGCDQHAWNMLWLPLAAAIIVKVQPFILTSRASFCFLLGFWALDALEPVKEEDPKDQSDAAEEPEYSI